MAQKRPGLSLAGLYFSAAAGAILLLGAPWPVPLASAGSGAQSKTYVAAPQVLPSGFELGAEVAVRRRRGRLVLHFSNASSPLPEGTILFESDSVNQTDLTLRSLVAYAPSTTDPAGVVPVRSTEDIPVVCAADFARQCYVREGGQAALRPLADGEQLAAAGAAVTYELVPGNTGRFVGASLADLQKRPSSSRRFVTEQLLGASVQACKVPRYAENAQEPLLTSVQQLDPVCHRVFPSKRLPPAAPVGLMPPVVSPGESIQLCEIGDEAALSFLLTPASRRTTTDGAANPQNASSPNNSVRWMYGGPSARCEFTGDTTSVSSILATTSSDLTRPASHQTPARVPRFFTVPFVPSARAPVPVEDMWRETATGRRRRVEVYARLDGSRLEAVGSISPLDSSFDAFGDVNLNRLSRKDEKAEPFFYESLYDRSPSVPVGLTLMKSGVGFSVKRAPEALLLLSDLLLAPIGSRAKNALAFFSPLTRVAEHVATRLHRLKGHFSKKKVAEMAAAIMPQLDAALKHIEAKTSAVHSEVAAANPEDPSATEWDVQLHLNYLDASMARMSVIVRLPVRLRRFNSVFDVAPQVLRALRLLVERVENAADGSEAVALALGGSRFGLFSEAVRTATRVLAGGHCKPCTNPRSVPEGECGMCDVFKTGDDSVILSLNDIVPSQATMPATGTWAAWSDDQFLISSRVPASANGSSAENKNRKNLTHRRVGVEFDYHTQLGLPDRMAARFEKYAADCVRSRVIESLERLSQDADLVAKCPSVSPVVETLFRSADFASVAPLLASSNELLQHTAGACGASFATAIQACLDLDGDILGHRRMPAFQPIGRSRLVQIITSLMTPVPANDFLEKLANGAQRLHALPAGPLTQAALAASEIARRALETMSPQALSLVSYVFGPAAPLSALSDLMDKQTRSTGFTFTSDFFTDPIETLENLFNPEAVARRPRPDDEDQDEYGDGAGSGAGTKAQRGQGAGEIAADSEQASSSQKMDAPVLEPVDRTLVERMPQQSVRDYVSSLKTNSPELAKPAYDILKWPDSKSPADEKELRMLENAVNDARLRKGDERIPSPVRKLVDDAIADYQQAQQAASPLDEEPEESEASSEPGQETGQLAAAYNKGEETLRTVWGSGEGAKESQLDTPFAGASPVPREAYGTPRAQLWGQGQITPRLISAPAPGPRSGTAQPNFMWPYVHKVITQKTGPATRMPVWVQTSPTCPCSDPDLSQGCMMDAVKSTSDVIFRLSLLVPPAVERFMQRQGGGRRMSPEFAAFCASAGLFVASWQQQLMATGYEDIGATRAHLALVERLANGHKFLLKTYSDEGTSDHKAWRSRRRKFHRFQKKYLYKQCRALMLQAGNVAFATNKTQQHPASSLYGGIANTLNTTLTDATQVLRALSTWGETALRRHLSLSRRVGRVLTRKTSQAAPIAALFAGLQVSGILKRCFNTAGGYLVRTWYYMHIAGEPLLELAKRLPGERTSDLARLSYEFLGGERVRAKLFEPAFREISKVVTAAWESEELFTKLASYVPGDKGTSARPPLRTETEDMSPPPERVRQPHNIVYEGSASGAHGFGTPVVRHSGGPRKEYIYQGGGGAWGKAATWGPQQSGDAEYFSFAESQENRLRNHADASSGPHQASTGGQLTASFRYNPVKYRRRDRDLMLVEVPLDFSGAELEQLAEMSSDQVLSLLHKSLEKLHQQLRIKNSLLTGQHLSLVQFEEHSPGRGKASMGAAEKCLEGNVKANLVKFLADQLRRDLRQEHSPTIYLELNRQSLPPLSAGAVIAETVRDDTRHPVLAVQMPDFLDDSHLRLDASTLDFSAPIVVSGH
ncbi:rhoptry neck protein ron4 [Cystoisospora suis]|uniref:Rhoptry neck protein ron4 n=1 Tax=Cystoisospora suis TaxID=483139 RepID=A0A2C6KNP6_9APIC|nr:rhoptry neck protein ron4 [Cystoisospora suis]